MFMPGVITGIRFLRRFFIHGDYAQYFNRETHRVGHVFGERFSNKVVQVNEYGIWLSRYIYRQPLEAGLVDEPKDYPWTSYRRYLGLEEKDFIKNDLIIQQFGERKEATKNYEILFWAKMTVQ